MKEFDSFVRISVAGVLGMSPDDISADSLLDDPRWDSLSVVAMISYVESVYGVEISPDDIDRLINARYVRELTAIVEGAVNANEARLVR